MDDFKAPQLKLELSGASSADRLLNLIRQSPIGARYGDYFSALNLQGPTRTQMRLTLPLKPGVVERKLLGSTQFEGVALNNEAWQLALSDMHGLLHFDDAGFHTERIDARNLRQQHKGEPRAIAMLAAVGDRHTKTPGQSVQVALSGKMSAQTLFGEVRAMAPIVAACSGESHWDIVMQVARAPGSERNISTLRLASDLAGAAIDLPPPLGKTAAQSRALSALIPLDLDARPLQLFVDDRVRYTAYSAFDSKPFSRRAAPGARQLEHGGALLQHIKENILHSDLGAEDRYLHLAACDDAAWRAFFRKLDHSAIYVKIAA
ncbi:hypothetical protein HC761_01480, partial [bacterium]|nr:hypothetical protein [bacterium]